MNFKKFFYRDYFERPFPVRIGHNIEQRQISLAKPINEAEFKEIKKRNKDVFDVANKAITQATLTPDDLALLNLPTGMVCGFPLKTLYPGLITGTGYTHETNNEREFKLGFYFDHTTGLPCIPGSSVKGLLRSAFPQFKTEKSNPFSQFKPMSEIQESKFVYIKELFHLESDTDPKRAVHLLELAIFEGIDMIACQQLFNNGKPEQVDYYSIYERVIFHHANIIRTKGNTIFEIDTITPHGGDPLKNPTPLNFLKIKPEVTFQFNFVIPNLIQGTNTHGSQVLTVFNTILKDIGIGAKTNVGYGQFKEPTP